MSEQTPHGISAFLNDVLKTQGGKLVLECYQCGTCSGSCPVIDEMEYGPRQIMHLIQLGKEAEVLSCRDMWRCVSCYACASRCPRSIEITDLMADLRRIAIDRGYASDKEAEFGLAFAQTLQAHGRLFEPELLVRYYARVLDLVSLIGMAPLGVKMLLKGKLPFRPERVEDPGEIAVIGVVRSTKPIIGSGLRRRTVAARAKTPIRGIVGGGILSYVIGLLASLKNGRPS
jgi:heterodisulfide reductase subunit C